MSFIFIFVWFIYIFQICNLQFVLGYTLKLWT